MKYTILTLLSFTGLSPFSSPIANTPDDTVLSFHLAGTTAEDTLLVHNINEFNEAVGKAGPGDTIVLANGIWRDTELLFEGKGTAEKPIFLTAEEKGKVFLEGASNLRIAGEHLVVSGLVFRNGYTPTSEVISFRKDDQVLANNCRVTECVIDNYSNPERFETDTWVALYGKNNRFDHNSLTGKGNHGVTLAVKLKKEESRENHHRIDHNYFGPRPNLGANGGETIRIGTSHYSLTNSNTLVEYNFFEKCNGEHEIVSNKSCQNTYRYNTFFECKGTLTMRHGHETLVEGNVFLGNGKPNTGGIRVINERQTAINNYCEGLTGYRFRGALVIMNGVPNSPLNRYGQVIDAHISNNTFINCDHVQFCAGSDEERSSVPVNTFVSDNIFYNENKDSLFTIYDDISGITFKGNLVSRNVDLFREEGFRPAEINFSRNNDGLLVPENARKKGTGLTEIKATTENTGVSWYTFTDNRVDFGKGETIKAIPGTNTLYEAVQNSASGDIIELSEPGVYMLSKSLDIRHPLSIVAAPGITEKPVIKFQKTALFAIENGGSLSLKGITVDGGAAPDSPGNSVIRTSRYSMNRNYTLLIDQCEFRNLTINHSFDVIENI